MITGTQHERLCGVFGRFGAESSYAHKQYAVVLEPLPKESGCGFYPFVRQLESKANTRLQSNLKVKAYTVGRNAEHKRGRLQKEADAEKQLTEIVTICCLSAREEIRADRPSVPMKEAV